MKKRSISLLLCLVMIFSLLPFSAMAQVYPVTSETQTVTVRFYKGTGEGRQKIGDDQIVNNRGNKVEKGAIYDPGCTLGDHEVFKTWSFGGQTGGVDDICTYLNVAANWTALQNGSKVLEVTAVTAPVRYLVYYDESGRVLKTVSAEVKGSTAPEVTVDLDYVPATAGQDFMGWNTESNGTGTPYMNGSKIALTSLFPASL